MMKKTYDRFAGTTTMKTPWGSKTLRMVETVTYRTPKSAELVERYLRRFFPEHYKKIIPFNPHAFTDGTPTEIEVRKGTVKGITEASQEGIVFTIGRSSYGFCKDRKLSQNISTPLVMSSRFEKRLAMKRILQLLTL